MTHFLVSDDNADGFRLEDILTLIRKDMLYRCNKIVDDQRDEALYVMNNNMKILNLISDAIDLARDSTNALDQAFGKSVKGGPPRIGEP